MALRSDRRKPTVHVVTEARTSRYDDIAQRQKRYLVRMAIRTAAVLVAFFAPLPIWARALAIVLGLVLPWISVTSANAGPLPQERMRHFDPSVRELPSAAEPDGGPKKRAS
jgi:Protein of unknown function (DUF3099)